MANVKISQLTSASALTGSEVIPVVQSGITKKTTAQAIANLGGGGGGLGSLDINADGSIGSGNVTYYYSAAIPSTYTGGDASFPVQGSPSITLSSQSGYGGGGPFTAVNVEFSTLTLAYDLNVNNTGSLKNISAPLLTSISSQITISSNSALESLSFPSLTKINQFQLSNNNVQTPLSLNFPVLTEANISTQNGSNLLNLNSINFPVLAKASFNLYDQSTLTVDLSSVTQLSNLNFAQNYNTTVVNLPGLVKIITAYIQFSLYNLEIFSLGTAGTLKSAGSNGQNMYIDLNQCKLNQASVDGLLTTFASLDGTNGTTVCNNGSMYLQSQNAAPSQIGLDAKVVLQNRGWNVGTN